MGEERCPNSAEGREEELSRLRLQTSIWDPTTIRHLETIGVAQGWTRLEHDILKDELEKNYYDLVHCCFLLMHLPEPQKAPNRMANAIHPSGDLAFHDQEGGEICNR